MGPKLFFELLIDPQDGKNGDGGAGLVDDLEPERGPVGVAAREAVDTSGLSDVGEDGHKNRDDGVLEDHDPAPAVPVGGADGALGALGAHQAHRRQEDVAAIVRFRGQEAAHEDEEVGQGDGRGRVEPRLQVDVDGRRADLDQTADAVDGDEGAYPQDTMGVIC